MDFVKQTLQLIFMLFSTVLLAQTEIGAFYRFGQLSAGTSNSWFNYKESNMGFSLKSSLSKKIAVQIAFDKQLKSENFIDFTYFDKNQWKFSSKHFIYVNFDKNLPAIYDKYYTSRMNFIHQLNIKKQISKKITLQFSPTFVHFNLVQSAKTPHDQFFLGTQFKKIIGEKSYFLAEHFLAFQNYPNARSNFLKIAYIFPLMNSELEFSLCNHLSNYVMENSAINEQKWKHGNVNLGIQYLYSFQKK